MGLPHRLAAVVGAAVLVATTAGCSLFDDETHLEAALQRVAATDATRAFVEFGDTAALVEVSGRGDAEGSDPWYALRSYGAGGLVAATPEEAARSAIRPLDADYMIAAGGSTATVAVVSGGQDGERVAGTLEGLGWRPDGGRLLAPPAADVPAELGGLAVWLGQVRADGSDVVYGGVDARLEAAGKPSGDTLADDRRYAALADCAGEVIAAALAPGGGGARPSAVAVGIYRPSSADATVRSVVCTSWDSRAAADEYAAALPSALATGTSSVAGPFAELYTNTEITTIGGEQHVVRLRADTGGWRDIVFQALRNGELPGVQAG